MAKSKSENIPNWVHNLRTLMEENGLNPRSLSLRAGLNATAVRDMLEGRSRFPRYDTVQALAETLNTTPALLMSDNETAGEGERKGLVFGKDLELLTEIIARLQEIVSESSRKLSARDFAAMVASIYHRMQDGEDRKKKISSVRPQIHDLLDYEMLRQRRNKR